MQNLLMILRIISLMYLVMALALTINVWRSLKSDKEFRPKTIGEWITLLVMGLIWPYFFFLKDKKD